MSPAIDRLGNLPKNVTEAILMHLPLRDVVRTSILSHYWRYKWITLPELVFDKNCVPYADGNEYDKKIVQIVNQVLFLHHGPIHKFKIDNIHIDSLETCGDIDRWIVYLSRNGIKDLTLETWEGEFLRVSSCLYLCEELTYLRLNGCFTTLPLSFKGFSSLTTLNLRYVDFCNNGFEILISSCPLLTKLVLEYVNDFGHLKICALKLIDLKIDTEFVDLCIENTPLLSILSINLSEEKVVSDGAVCKLTQLFGSLPMIERLELCGFTFPILLGGDVPLKLPTACQLKYLSIELNFEDMQQILATLCIFRSSPILQELCITAFGDTTVDDIHVTNFWGTLEDFNCLFSQLRTVEVANFTGTKSELKFVEFVLANAPVLETVQIELNKGVADTLNILKEMINLRRVSSKAKIVFLP